MLVRKAKQFDLKPITDFQLSMASETEGIVFNEPTVASGVSAVLNDTNKGQYYVTESDNKIIASLLTTYEWSDWRNGTILWIQSVYVLPEFRRQGVYKKMYSFIKELVLANENLNGIRLYADKSNLPAHKTYENLGMSPDHYFAFEWLK